MILTWWQLSNFPYRRISRDVCRRRRPDGTDSSICERDNTRRIISQIIYLNSKAILVGHSGALRVPNPPHIPHPMFTSSSFFTSEMLDNSCSFFLIHVDRFCGKTAASTVHARVVNFRIVFVRYGPDHLDASLARRRRRGNKTGSQNEFEC